MAKLLSGIRVVELGTYVAVPKAARLMSEWGAEVIKVEPPKGEAYRKDIPAIWQLPHSEDNNPIFENENSSKQSLCLDLKDPAAKEIMYKLLETADVFLTNTRPKPLAKLGIDYESLKEKFPRLIYGHFSGFGDSGPDKDRPGFDVTSFWARGGMLTEWSLAESTPNKPTPGFGDGATSSMLVSGILAALYNREKTGKGEMIRVSLLGAALWYNSTGVVQGQPQYGKVYPAPRIPCRVFNPLFKTKDNDWLLLSVPDYAAKYQGILKLLGLEKYVEDPRFQSMGASQEHSPELMPILDEAFGKMATADLLKGLVALDVNHSKLANPADLYKDEQAWANGYLYEQTMGSGDKVVLSRPPVRFASMADEPGRRAPYLGEHSVEIMTRLGYTMEEINKNITGGAVVQHK
ncbi:MAG: CoA transferase [Gracilibacteraceae bacterium]|jgi:crotonobetainyl-CoA:carnitine CoA-transferase CaiB-like acyl-CoA transferase|nr:CoA transferase [Gracilibacteraceae bacterium]